MVEVKDLQHISVGAKFLVGIYEVEIKNIKILNLQSRLSPNVQVVYTFRLVEDDMSLPVEVRDDLETFLGFIGREAI